MKSGKALCFGCGKSFKLAQEGVVLLKEGFQKPFCDKCFSVLLGLEPGKSERG